jgi:hypothetical protein
VTTAANLSTTRQFHFMITDQTTGAVKCIGKATALTSSTFTVTMTTDANAASGDYVTITLCAAAEDQIRADCAQFGTYANAPTTAKTGDRYKCTDALYDGIYSGGQWNWFAFGLPVTPPPSGGWTSENLGAGTVNYTNGNGYLLGGHSGILNMEYRTPPSTPYSFIVKFRVDQSGIISSLFVNGAGSPGVSTFSGFAVGFRDSSGKYVVMLGSGGSGNNYCFFGIGRYNSYSSNNGYAHSFSDTDIVQQAFGSPANFWIKIRNDGTNITFSVSLDRNNWYVYHSETITNFLAAASYVCWGSNTQTYGAAICLDDWTQGT